MLMRFMVCFGLIGFGWSVTWSAERLPESSSSVVRKNEVELFMDSFIEEVARALSEKDKKKRFEDFKQLARRYFDMPSITNFLLGGAKQAGEQRVIDILENYIVTLYLSKFDSYGRILQVSNFERQRVFKLFPDNPKSPWNVRMNLHIVEKGKNQNIAMDWRVFPTKTGYKVLDVYVEGISLSQTKREEFASVQRSKGVEGLIQDLKTRSDQP